jgi:hypothetical protein
MVEISKLSSETLIEEFKANLSMKYTKDKVYLYLSTMP